MCDFNSVGSAFLSLQEGRIDAANIKSIGEFDSVQLQAQGVIAAANLRNEATAVRREFTEQLSRNTAAMAISGLSPESFSGIEKGNRENLRENEANLDADAGTAQDNASAAAKMARMGAKIEARLAKKNGVIQAVGTLLDAERSYQDTNTGTTRLGHAMIGAGVSKDQLKKTQASLGGSFFMKG